MHVSWCATVHGHLGALDVARERGRPLGTDQSSRGRSKKDEQILSHFPLTRSAQWPGELLRGNMRRMPSLLVGDYLVPRTVLALATVPVRRSPADPFRVKRVCRAALARSRAGVLRA